MLKEFREFITKGNMVEIAIGLLMAAAFGGVVSALTKDLLNPIVGLFTKVDFGNMMIVLKDNPEPLGKHAPFATVSDAINAKAVVIAYGDFITVLVNFLITAVAVFIMLKAYNKLVKKPEPVLVVEEPAPTKEEILLAEIRDLLKAK